jgi:transposase
MDRGGARPACAAQGRYPSDLTDAEWKPIKPMIPEARQERPATQDGHARGDERSPLHVAPGLPAAATAEGFSAAFDGLHLFP